MSSALIGQPAAADDIDDGDQTTAARPSSSAGNNKEVTLIPTTVASSEDTSTKIPFLMATSSSASSLRAITGVTFAPLTTASTAGAAQTTDHDNNNDNNNNRRNATWDSSSNNNNNTIRARRFSNSAAASSLEKSSASGFGTTSSASLLSSSTVGPAAASTTTSSSRVRVYRSSLTDKLTTRDIAALDFLLGIPLEAEESIVQLGWMLQQRRKKTFRSAGVMDDDDDEEDDRMYGSEDEGPYHRKRDEINRDLEPPGSTVTTTTTTTAQLTASSNHSHHGRWWEKWVPRESHSDHFGPSAHHHNNLHNHLHFFPKRHKDDGELESPAASTGLIAQPNSISNEMVQHGTPRTDITSHSTASHVTTAAAHPQQQQSLSRSANSMPTAPIYAPGRRLEGDDAILVQIPLKIDTVTRQKSIARQAAIREWEVKVAHGLMGIVDNQQQGITDTATAPGKNMIATSAQNHPTNNGQLRRQQPPLLDGRLFFSAAGSYPLGVFSLKRYEPKREEAALRRQKLEARGGGGSHFVIPSRDWRGISFRALLPRKVEHSAFNRFLTGRVTNTVRKSPASKRRPRGDSDLSGMSENNHKDDDEDSDSEDTLSSSSSEDSYIPGILDNPEMKLGRHRNVMIGDYITGCVVASTIQFVKPALLKADLNQKFRDRFDGWEPSKSQRKYIGARVIDGVYTLIDPTESEQQQVADAGMDRSRLSQVSAVSSAATPAIIRMPPSLTLSKIRSVKGQALMAFVRADLEIGTVALACVYFERLCLSCRVDKMNRRLCFASCILLASKINEPTEVLVIREDSNLPAADTVGEEERNTNTRKQIKRLQSSIRPNKRSSTMFASLLEFFTQEWSLSLKHLFAAEWAIFAVRISWLIASRVKGTVSPEAFSNAQHIQPVVSGTPIFLACQSFTGCFSLQALNEDIGMEPSQLLGPRNVCPMAGCFGHRRRT
jgi:Cyclin, N-terminal domain